MQGRKCCHSVWASLAVSTEPTRWMGVVAGRHYVVGDSGVEEAKSSSTSVSP